MAARREPPRFCAVVVAAGRGHRFGRPKQLIELGGHPMIGWSLRVFEAIPELDDLVIATEPENVEAMQRAATKYAPRLTTNVVMGGATRHASVRNALRAVSGECEAVFVHDGARPLVLVDDVRAGMAVIEPGVGAVLAERVVDTIKIVPSGSTTVARTLDRDELWAAQTPQFAMLADLLRAHDAAERDGIEATDDVALLERLGLRVVVVPASAENFKVTLPADRDRAEAVLQARLAGARL